MVNFIKEYQKLLRIRRLAEYPLFGRPRSIQHYNQSIKLRELARANHDELITLILSDRFSEPYQRHELVMLGAHGGSLHRKDNIEWWEFMEKLRQYKAGLYPEIVGYLDWLLEVHGW